MSDPTECTICTLPLQSRIERSRHVCDSCATKTGVVALHPSKRPRNPCSKCHHTSFVRAIPREIAQTAGPMFAAYELTGSPFVAPIDPRRGFGVFEVFICKRCGFVEWYCEDPQEIPIGPEYMTEDVDVADAPFR